MLLAAFSFGAYTRLPRRATKVLWLLAGLSAAMLAQGSDGHLDGGFWVGGGLFWVMGLLYRQRLLRVSELEGETTRLKRDRDAAARAAVAEERSRIARELHDVVAHSVSVMTVQAGAARHTLDPAETEMQEALKSIETAGRQALVELRRLLGILRQADDEPALAPVPSLADLDRLIAQLHDAGLPTVLHIEGESAPLPPGVDLAAYRIVQEALTNCLKHAGPTRAEVRVCYRRHELELEVLDDGRSNRAAGNGTGHGLIGMRERVSLYGGFFEAGPRPDGGFAVHARLPLDGNLR
jgi:signal transduction histidine kinase